MIEITIKTNDEVALQRLLQFIKSLGLEISTTKPATIEGTNATTNRTPTKKRLPKIQWAKEPEKVKAFFGIWKDHPVSEQQFRNTAWGGRI